MLEIEMSKDIKNFEPKIIGPFTLRQIACIGISCAYGIPFFILFDVEIVTRVMVTLALMAPVILCGWIKIYDVHLEQFIKIIFISKFVKPSKRKYKTKSMYTNPNTTNQQKVKRSKTERGWR